MSSVERSRHRHAPRRAQRLQPHGDWCRACGNGIACWDDPYEHDPDCPHVTRCPVGRCDELVFAEQPDCAIHGGPGW
jgi:hypothetical protein